VELANDGEGSAEVTLVPDLPQWMSLDWGSQTVPPHKSLATEALLTCRGLAPGVYQHHLRFTYTAPTGDIAELVQPLKFQLVAPVVQPRQPIRVPRLLLAIPLLALLAFGIWFLLPKGSAAGPLDVEERITWAQQCVAAQDWQRAISNLEQGGQPIASTNQQVIWLLGWCYKELPSERDQAVKYLTAYLQLNPTPGQAASIRQALQELGQPAP
jgi:tetratricopeptide (TPR) repeat protein